MVFAFVVLPAGAAFGDHTNQTDPDDVAGLLDVEEVRFRHDPLPYVWVFRTHQSWTTKKIWDKGYFVVELDTLGEPAPDYFVLLRSTGKEMKGELFRIRANGSQVRLRSLDGWRAGPRGAGVELPARLLVFGAHRTSFFWWTFSLFTSEKCRATCIDAVPDEGTVEQALGE
jgi:hypothetical protein